VITNLKLSNCTIRTGAQRTVDLSTLTISEEVSFCGMDLQNYQSLSLLKSITIEDCDSITDVSCFSNVKKLKFSCCPNITDVSSLNNVRELSLCYCECVTDVSSLGRVYNLELSHCYCITDVSALGNVHILNLNESTRVKEVSALKNVYELHLELFNGNNLNGLENVVKLFLDDSYSIADTVKELHIAQCLLITDFHSLKNLQVLEIGHRNES
jgi:hypothetical protein